MKKTILSFVLSTGLFSILISCWCQKVPPYWGIIDFKIDILDENQDSIINNQVNTNTIFLDVVLNSALLAYTPFNPFENTCYASQPCPVGGESGMKDPISNIDILSNTDFNNYTAGQPLDSIAVIDGLFLDDWLESKTYNSYYGNYATNNPHFMVELSTRPTNNLTHVFSVRIEHESGTIMTVQSDTITWN
jgi:hypothetical protein